MRFLRHVRRCGPELLILASGLVFALLSRGRHANVTEDHGFWFSAVQGLLSGGRAMHEVRLQYGPVSLWILEAACRVFGTRAATIVVLQFVVGLAGIVGVQLLSRRFLSAVERWLSAAILVPLIVWMVGPGNLLYPCAFAMSHGLLLAVLTVLLQDSFVRRGFWKVSLIAGVLAGVVLLTKQEFGVAAFAGILAVTCFAPALSRQRKAGAIAIASIGLVAAYFGILILARHGDSLRHLVDSNLLWPWAPVPDPWRQLFWRYLGLDAPAQRLREAFGSLAAVAAFGGTTWLVLHFRHVARRAAVASAVGLAWLLWAWRWSEGSHFLPMTLALPAIFAALLLMWFRGQSEKPHPSTPSPGGEGGSRVVIPANVGVQNPVVVVNEDRNQAFLDSRFRGNDTVLPDPPSPSGEGGRGVRFQDEGAFVALVLGALVLLQREGYRGGIEGYYSGMGYVLAVPLVVPLLWWLARGPESSPRGRVAAATVLFAILAWFGIGRLHALERGWKDSVPFETARGRLYVPSGMAPTIFSTADFIREHSNSKDPILILPSTFGLDFLLDRANLAFFPYVTPGFLTVEGERELIEGCARTPPRAVVVFEHTFGVLRSGDFEHGFADALIAWLKENLPEHGTFRYPGGQAGLLFWKP